MSDEFVLITYGKRSIIILYNQFLMEDSKNNFGSFFQLPWVKALIAFIVFLLIFLAGAAFGSHYGRSNGFIRSQTLNGQRGNMMYRSNRLGVPANGSVNIQGGSGTVQPPSAQNSGTPASGSVTQ